MGDYDGDAAAVEGEGDVREGDVVAGAKADACWVPGMVDGRWI